MHSDLLDNSTAAVIPLFLPTSPCCRPGDGNGSDDGDGSEGEVRHLVWKVVISVVILIGIAAGVLFGIKKWRNKTTIEQQE